MSAGVPAGVTDAQLAVLLRQVQWALDDAAHELPAGRATVGRRVELAGRLEVLADVLRASSPGDRPGPALSTRSPSVGEGGDGGAVGR